MISISFFLRLKVFIKVSDELYRILSNRLWFIHIIIFRHNRSRSYWRSLHLIGILHNRLSIRNTNLIHASHSVRIIKTTVNYLSNSFTCIIVLKVRHRWRRYRWDETWILPLLSLWLHHVILMWVNLYNWTLGMGAIIKLHLAFISLSILSNWFICCSLSLVIFHVLTND